MGSNQRVRQFILDCFRERTEALQAVMQVHREFRGQFYSDSCIWDSRPGFVEDSKGGKVVEISRSDAGADVITTGSCTYCARYRVEISSKGCSIYDVQIKCGRCQNNGSDAQCGMCRGTGWQSSKSIHRKSPFPRNSAYSLEDPSELILNGENGRLISLEPKLAQFMTNHLNERTAFFNKQSEIYEAYRARFYSSDCDWDSMTVNAKGTSSEEKIMSVADTGKSLLVLTQGYTFLRLRYRLRRKGSAWQIREVDSECVMCYLEGRKDNCIFCHGSVWRG